MKERMKISGVTPREEMIRDGQNLLKEELEHDSSYSPTMYFYDTVNKKDDRIANLRVYSRKYSSLNGNYMNFLTTYDNPVRIGDYIHDTKDNTYWLVYNSFNVNDIHYEGKLIQCNYLLRWQLLDGKIVERWANIVSASKYDIGESGNSVVVLSSNNFTILIGYCEEGFELEGKRVFIDKRSNNPEKVFKITRGDDVLFDSGNMGSLLSFIADKTEFDINTDRPDLGICDYKEPSTSLPPSENQNETINLSASISGSSNIKIGFPRTYTVTFTDKNSNDINWDTVQFSWNIISNFNKSIEQEVKNNTIRLLIQDDIYIDEKIKLQVLVDNAVIKEMIISVSEAY